MHEDELARLQAACNADGESQKNALGEMSRKLTLALVQEKAQARKNDVLCASVASLRREINRLEEAEIRTEVAVTERLGYLERCKEASTFKLAALQRELSESVPLRQLEEANRQCESMATRYRQAMAQSNARIESHRSYDEVNRERLHLQVSFERGFRRRDNPVTVLWVLFFS